MHHKHSGTGLNKGHGGNTPNLPKIRETNHIKSMIQPGSRTFKMGRAQIFVSPPFDEQGWHMSISRPDKYPSWDEIAKARYELIDNDLVMVMVLPRPEDYINIHNYCFHLHELLDESAI